MKYYKVREKIIESIEEEYGSLDNCDPGFEVGVNATLRALSDLMESKDYTASPEIFTTPYHGRGVL